MKLLQTALLLQLVLWLSACVSPPIKEPSQVTANWQKQQRALNKIQHWTISGRIAVQTEDNGGQADYVWKQTSLSEYDIRLQAPLGAGTTWITSRLNGVSLKTSTGVELFDHDIDKLMLQVNGWPLPVSGLRYWVRGLPAAKASYEITEWNDNGMPAVIMQDGWRIEFRKHVMVSGTLLPQKIFINRQGEEEVDVRLIIRQWDLADA